MSVFPRRQFLLAATTLAAASALTACFGSFGATTALWRFNSKVSDSKWLNWLVFLGLVIIPVYELFTLADVIIINTIEFYTGKNPITASTRDLGRGRVLALSRDPQNPERVRAEIRVEHGGRDAERHVFFIEKVGSGFVLMNADLRVLAHATDERGLIELFDGEGALLLSMDAQTAASLGTSLGDAIEAGDSPIAVLEAHLRSTGRASLVASAGPRASAF